MTDVEGIRVGQVQRTSAGWCTGSTVVLMPPGTVGGVDVRGGAPGTRDTDLLRPENAVTTVDAVCLTGGSAYGLAVADGVMRWLEAAGRGVSVGPRPSDVVPIVPTAVIFDLGRGGRFGARPDADFGWRAARAASRTPERQGSVGAGTGARAGGLQGGVGSASRRVGPHTLGVLAVVNAVGSVIDPLTALPYESQTWSMLGLVRPSAAERRRVAHVLAAPPAAALNTTIGVVATSCTLDKAAARRLAMAGHDGLARAVRPAHLWRDGDTVFSAATGRTGSPSSLQEHDALLEAAADLFALACTRAVVSARSHRNGPPAWRDLAASAAPAG